MEIAVPRQSRIQDCVCHISVISPSSSYKLTASLMQIEHFAGTLFHGLGPSILNRIQDEGLLADPADFYTLTVDVLSKLDGLSKKSAVKLVKVIQVMCISDVMKILHL